MYADTVTDSMKRAICETQRRRKIQLEYNVEHGIDPQTIRKKVTDILLSLAAATTPAPRREQAPPACARASPRCPPRSSSA